MQTHDYPRDLKELFIQPFLNSAHSNSFAQVTVEAMDWATAYGPHPNHCYEWWTCAGIDKKTQQPKFVHVLRYHHSPTIFADMVCSHVSPEPKFTKIQWSAKEIRVPELVVWKSIHENQVFPVSLTWQGGATSIIQVPNKPLCMFRSNGCMSCSDGIGVKQYMYSHIETDDWQGFVAHGWESRTLPPGKPVSTALSILSHMEQERQVDPQSYLYIKTKDNHDHWIHVDYQSVLRSLVQLPTGETKPSRVQEFKLEHDKISLTMNDQTLSFSFDRRTWLPGLVPLTSQDTNILYAYFSYPLIQGTPESWEKYASINTTLNRVQLDVSNPSEHDPTEHIFMVLIWIIPGIAFICLSICCLVLLRKWYMQSRYQANTMSFIR